MGVLQSCHPHPDLLEVRDATADLRFATNPLVVGSPFIRFYAGQPLIVEGIRIGTLSEEAAGPVSGIHLIAVTDRLEGMAEALGASGAERRRTGRSR